MTDDAETDEQQDHLNDASFDLIIDSASYRERISVQPSRRSILVSGTITNILGWSESWSSTPVVRSMLFSGSIQIGEEAYLPGSHSVKVSTGDRATQTEPSSLGCLSFGTDPLQCYVALYFPQDCFLREQLISHAQMLRSLRVRLTVPSCSIYDKKLNHWVPIVGVDHVVTEADCVMEIPADTGLHSASAIQVAYAKLEAIITGSEWRLYGWKLGHTQFTTIAGELIASLLLKPETAKLRVKETNDQIYQTLQIASDFYNSLAMAE